MNAVISLGDYALQKFPRSFMLTIPKQWVLSNDLKKGTRLSISVLEDGSLLIKPVKKREAEL